MLKILCGDKKLEFRKLIKSGSLFRIKEAITSLRAVGDCTSLDIFLKNLLESKAPNDIKKDIIDEILENETTYSLKRYSVKNFEETEKLIRKDVIKFYQKIINAKLSLNNNKITLKDLDNLYKIEANIPELNTEEILKKAGDFLFHEERFYSLKFFKETRELNKFLIHTCQSETLRNLTIDKIKQTHPLELYKALFSFSYNEPKLSSKEFVNIIKDLYKHIEKNKPIEFKEIEEKRKEHLSAFIGSHFCNQQNSSTSLTELIELYQFSLEDLNFHEKFLLLCYSKNFETLPYQHIDKDKKGHQGIIIKERKILKKYFLTILKRCKYSAYINKRSLKLLFHIIDELSLLNENINLGNKEIESICEEKVSRNTLFSTRESNISHYDKNTVSLLFEVFDLEKFSIKNLKVFKKYYLNFINKFNNKNTLYSIIKKIGAGSDKRTLNPFIYAHNIAHKRIFETIYKKSLDKYISLCKKFPIDKYYNLMTDYKCDTYSYNHYYFNRKYQKEYKEIHFYTQSLNSESLFDKVLRNSSSLFSYDSRSPRNKDKEYFEENQKDIEKRYLKNFLHHIKFKRKLKKIPLMIDRNKFLKACPNFQEIFIEDYLDQVIDHYHYFSLYNMLLNKKVPLKQEKLDFIVAKLIQKIRLEEQEKVQSTFRTNFKDQYWKIDKFFQLLEKMSPEDQEIFLFEFKLFPILNEVIEKDKINKKRETFLSTLKEKYFLYHLEK